MKNRVQITCLCTAVHEVVTLGSPLPNETIACHWNTCRHTSGALYCSVLIITSRPECTDKLTGYGPVRGIIRFFCPTCGCHICQNVHGTDEWAVLSGVVDQALSDDDSLSSHVNLEEIVQHSSVHETLDGGSSVWLAVKENASLSRRQAPKAEEATGSHGSGFEEQAKLGQPRTSNSLLTFGAACHCRGVEFFITRPNEASRSCSSPWPDLLVPYHSHASENPTDEKWWLRENNRFLAGTCACRSCRLSLGSPVQAWAFVPKANIFQLNGTSVDFKNGTLQAFESSPGVSREFCKTCGATIFWHSTGRPELIDVSVGIFRAQEGVRAENWLHWWTERVSFSEDAVDGNLIKSLEEGLRQYECSADNLALPSATG